MITAEAQQINFKYCAFIFAVACIIRLAFVIESFSIPAIRTPTPGLDVDLNWQAARIIASGASTDEPYFEPMMLSTPLYSYWLALGQKLIGDSMFIHRIINILIASMSAVLIFILVSRLVQSRWAAFTFSFMWTILPSLIYFDSTLHKSALEIFILISVLYIVTKKRSHLSAFNSVLTGSLVGVLLTALLFIQLNTFLYAVIFFVYIAAGKGVAKKEKFRILLPAVMIFTVSFLFFQFRNDLLNQRYPWFLPTKGVHTFIGFHKGAHGTYHQIKDIPPWPYGHTFYSRMNAEIQAQHPMTPDDSDRFYLRQTLNFIISNPAETLGLISTKALLFFNNYEVKGIDDLYYINKKSLILSLPPRGLGLFVMFAGLGVLRLLYLKKYRQGFLLCGILGCILASNIMTFVTWRYRLLNIVPLSLLAAHGLKFFCDRTLDLFTLRKPVMTSLITYALLVLLPLTACGWIAYRPVLEKERKGFFTRSSANDRLSMAAASRISRLSELESMDADTISVKWEKAFLLNALHRHSEAYRILKNLHEKGLMHPYGTYKYLVYLFWLGDYQRAVQLFSSISLQNPLMIPEVTRQLQGVEKKVYRLFVEPYRT